MQPDTPLVSIVTPSFNMARYLPRTIDSVLTQDYPKIDYLVLDAGSTDDTPRILAACPGRLRYRIAPDKGPADAIHLGLAEAGGEILAYLNADDTYEPGAVAAAVAYLAEHPEIDVVYGDGQWIDENGGLLGRYPTRPFDPRLLARECFICQPAAFMRARAYRACEIDPDIRASFDYDLWVRMAKQGCRFAYLPRHLANTRVHGNCISVHNREQVFQDSMTLLQRHYGYVPFPWVFAYAAFRSDGRDQFIQPLRPSLGKYWASLPLGWRYNRGQRWRFLGEWLAAPWRAVARRLRRAR
jgi:glycosyltransferase involved in cell wall biosynthesis